MRTEQNEYRSGVKIALSEIKAMLAVILVCNAVVSAVCIALAFTNKDVSFRVYTLFTGLACGNALMIANYLLIGYFADAVRRGSFGKSGVRRAKRTAGFSYAGRYAGMFLILALLLSNGLVNIVTAAIPLFYPKLYYTLSAVTQSEK
jgi:hypothetical protein